MFSKHLRLAKNKDVKAVFARGRTFFSPLMNVKFVAASQSRFTVVVSTKVSKKAVARNRLKRIIREFLRKNLGSLAGGDYAVILKPKATSVAEAVMIESLRGLLKANWVLKI